MPDAGQHRQLPSSWSDAFAALPLEPPAHPAWPRVAAALPKARRFRASRIAAIGLAAAAALAVVALVPRLVVEPAPADPVASVDTNAGTVANTLHRDSPAIDRPAVTAVVEPAARPAPLPASGPPDESAPAERVATLGSQPRPELEPEPEPDIAAVRAAGREAATLATTAADQPEPATAPLDDTLQRLQAESAQLEGLLALTRDDAVSSGAVAAVASELAGQVALVDAALAQPSLPSPQRVALWQDRVDALRQLAGFETTQRLLASRGERQDTLLVSVD